LEKVVRHLVVFNFHAHSSCKECCVFGHDG
jgi:hypothetical protein